MLRLIDAPPRRHPGLAAQHYIWRPGAIRVVPARRPAWHTIRVVRKCHESASVTRGKGSRRRRPGAGEGEGSVVLFVLTASHRQCKRNGPMPVQAQCMRAGYMGRITLRSRIRPWAASPQIILKKKKQARIYLNFLEGLLT
jgi:hypothetical protein